MQVNKPKQKSISRTLANQPLTALITGASSGIGLELSRLFAKDGINLVLVARNQQRLEQIAGELVQKFHIQVFSISIDLGEQKESEKIIHYLETQAIQIDILVNNAGTQVYGEFAQVERTHLSNLLHVNNTSLIELTHQFLPGMIERGYGYILNLGSTGSFAPGPLNAVYCASKAFVLNFSQALGAELSGTGISVTTLCPGATDTAFIKRHGLQDVRIFRHAMSARRVAEIGYQAMWRKRPVVVAGWANLIQVISFQWMAPFLPLTPSAWLKAIGNLVMGRSGSSYKHNQLARSSND